MAKRLDIAVWWNLPTGGARRALFDHAQGLAERGHRLRFWHPPVPSPHWMNPEALGETKIVELAMEVGGAGYVGRVLRHLLRSSAQMKAMMAHSSACGEQIAASGVDVLFANTCRHYHAPFIGRTVPADLPKVLYLQEPNRALYEADPELPWTGLAARRARSPQAKLRAAWDMAATRKLAREERDNAAAFPTILVNSRYSQESVRRAYGLNSTTCYLGVDTAKFQPSGKPDERYFLSVGALAPSKDPLLAVQAVAESGPNPLPLHWIAPYVNPNFKQSMVALADRLGVTLHIHELVDDEGLVQAYQGATAVIYVPRLEPFGYVSIEAAACGVPVVGVYEGGLRETVLDGATGFLHERDATLLGASLAKIAENESLRTDLAHAAREDALARWQLPNAIDRLEARLQQAVRK